jgi:hypothetical protein
MLGKIGVVGIAAVCALISANTLHPRELYNEMYPVEALKRDAFHICNDANPAFIRAVGADREACYASMPHIIAVALGRVRPGDAATLATLLDPSRQAELLMTLAAMPPRQPIATRRSFDDTAWTKSLSRSCDDGNNGPPVSYTAPAGSPALPGNGRAAALGSVVLGNLPPVTRAAKGGLGQQQPVPVIPLNGRKAAPATSPSVANADPVATVAPLPAPDVGDLESPAIVPLAPAGACGA